LIWRSIGIANALSFFGEHLIAKRKNWKFSKTGKLEIQQKWKFNKNWKTGHSTNQDLSQKQQNRNPMKLHFRCPEEQEIRKAVVRLSGTLPPDIPQIWNGRFCTLIL